MAIFVRSPGSCGEFIQGSLGGTPFLLTCPVNRYSHALADVQHPFRNNHFPLQAKARKARELTLALLGMEEENTPIYVRSDIPQGKGMASSSADIGAVAMATALLKGRELTLTELEKISLAIEPSDATFYPGVVLFDYLKGNLSKQMGVCPPMKIVIFDEGGSVDTVAFNNRVELPDLIREKEGLIEEALYLFELGINSKDVDLIGRASTISSFAIQRILQKCLTHDGKAKDRKHQINDWRVVIGCSAPVFLDFNNSLAHFVLPKQGIDAAGNNRVEHDHPRTGRIRTSQCLMCVPGQLVYPVQAILLLLYMRLPCICS